MSASDLHPNEAKVLDIIQSDFPLVSRPYEEIGRRVGLTEAETLAVVRALKDKGVIRRLGANFQSKKMGWVSTLCAAKTPPDKMGAFVEAVNAHPGVTHNYLRKHDFNIWFTLIAPSVEAREATLSDLSERTGVKILDLPADKMFKIKVNFKMTADDE